MATNLEWLYQNNAAVRTAVNAFAAEEHIERYNGELSNWLMSERCDADGGSDELEMLRAERDEWKAKYEGQASLAGRSSSSYLRKLDECEELERERDEWKASAMTFAGYSKHWRERCEKLEHRSDKRAAAVERLRMLDEFGGGSFEYAILGSDKMTWSYMDKRDALIDLLTDDDAHSKAQSKTVPTLSEHLESLSDGADSREKLEADIAETIDFWGAAYPDARVRAAIGWLDRQKAITEREVLNCVNGGKSYMTTWERMNAELQECWAQEHREHMDECEISSRLSIENAELRAERDELKERYDSVLEGRNRWSGIVDGIYRRFYPREEYCMPDDPTDMINEAIDAIEHERDEWKAKLADINAKSGSGMLTAEQVREAIEQHSMWVIGNNRCFRDGAYEDIADELNAELGSGTCENVWAEFGKFKCSECAMEVNAISTNTTTPRPIVFCPNCGRKAVER